MCPEYSTTVWRSRRWCGLHPRKSSPKVVQSKGGVTTSPTLLGPVLVCSQQNCVRLLVTRPVTSLGLQDGRRVFWERAKIFELCPIYFRLCPTHFSRGSKNFLGDASLPLPPWLRASWWPWVISTRLSSEDKWALKWINITSLNWRAPATYLAFVMSQWM